MNLNVLISNFYLNQLSCLFHFGGDTNTLYNYNQLIILNLGLLVDLTNSINFMVWPDIMAYNANVSAAFAGSIYCTTNTRNSSDERIKKERNDINDDKALMQILAIQPKNINILINVQGTLRLYMVLLLISLNKLYQRRLNLLRTLYQRVINRRYVVVLYKIR